MAISLADKWKSRVTFPLQIHAQEEYLHLQAQYIYSAAVEAVCAEIQQEENLDQDSYDDEQEAQETAILGQHVKEERITIELQKCKMEAEVKTLYKEQQR